MTMSLSRRTAVAVVVAVAVGVVASPVGTASAITTVGQTAADVNTESVCGALDSTGPAVTAVTSAPGSSPLVGAQTYYAGTNLTVVFCTANGEPASTDTWGLADHPGFTTVERLDRAYVVNLTERTTTIQFAEQVDQRDPDEGFSITITEGAVVSSGLSGEDQVSFASSETADSYNKAEQAYLNAIEAVESNITTVDKMVRSYNTSKELNITAVDETLQSLETARSALDATRNETESLLYRSASNGLETTAVLRKVNSRQVTGRAERENLSRALNEEIGRYKSEIRGTMLSGFAPGLVVGLLVGVLVPYWRKRKVEYDRKFTRTSGGSWVFRVPILLAVVALLVGLLFLLLSVPMQSVIG
jgi:hypothetical protein